MVQYLFVTVVPGYALALSNILGFIVVNVNADDVPSYILY